MHLWPLKSYFFINKDDNYFGIEEKKTLKKIAALLAIISI